MPVTATRRLLAPRDDGAVFADPPLDEALRQLAAPPAFGDVALFGRPLADLRAQARRDALQAARSYLRSAGEPVPAVATDRILAAGHQPELFHPGVWVKNFALHGLAAAAGLTPLNLVVDNDTSKATGLAVPVLGDDPSTYRIDKVAFDAWPGEVPFEEYAVRDEAEFASLTERVAAVTANWPFQPLLPSFWPLVLARRERTRLLGERLVAGRRDLERAWGCHNLELPLSALCETEPFAWFAGHILADLHRFHATYNDAVHDYRRTNHLRSRNHPVPDLAADGDWRELPLWAWRAGAQRRGRLFARVAADGFELRLDGQPWPRLPRTGPAFVKAWAGLGAADFKIRSRALTTTLFTRLLVADAFLHGIGGGKYDELTDELLRRFFGVTPPPYFVLSATLLLPLPHFVATAENARRLSHQLRDLHQNPQRYVPAHPLARQKRQLIEEVAAADAVGWQRHQELRRLTEELQPTVAANIGDVERNLTRTEVELRANAVVGHRDFGFCLYPEALLRPFCRRFLAPPSSAAASGS
jgi:hypothetical protein